MTSFLYCRHPSSTLLLLMKFFLLEMILKLDLGNTIPLIFADLVTIFESLGLSNLFFKLCMASFENPLKS